MNAREREIEEFNRWCDEIVELEQRVRRRLNQFVSSELLQAVEWLRVRAEVMAEEREEWTVQELDEAMEMFLDHLEEELLVGEGDARPRAKALATAAVAVVRYEMGAPYRGDEVRAWERARTLGSLVAWAREHPGGSS
ncbi:MAG: hypothetical protein M3R38_19405 [Actinomycetota bacterium]|nr:hypothetical protein [Actinomycetota bacterium]